MSFVKIATVSEVPVGTMKYVEVGGTELCIVNVSDKFYVIGDRCGHENASLSRGKLDGTSVTCPMHSSKFDVITGKKYLDLSSSWTGLLRSLVDVPKM